MELDEFKTRFPDIEPEQLFPHFPRMAVEEYPELNSHSWEDCHRGFMGAGGLFLVSEMAQRLNLVKGMRVLDLCCGQCASSIFLARHYGVRVIALDREIDPTENWKRIEAAGLADEIVPIKQDARDIPLPEGYFDAVFCLNSYFYFGTDDLYLPYLARFIRPGGRIGITSPCYASELAPDTPRELLYDPPGFEESYSVHSPQWWRRHFEAMGLVKLLTCQEHPKGREFWLDQVRWFLEQRHPREMASWMQEMVYHEIIMLLSDQDRFVTYMTLLAEKRP